MWTRQRQEQIDGPFMGFERSDLVEPEEDAKIEGCCIYIDYIKGLELQPELACKARRDELEVFMERGAYEVVPCVSQIDGPWIQVDRNPVGRDG